MVSMENERPGTYVFTWKVGVENYAANKATIVEQTGLLSSILSDPEWDNCSLNRTTSPDGTLTIAPRPAPPVHIPITAGMTNADIAVAKYNNDRHLIWHDALASFKSALIRSLGPTLEGTIGPPPDGFKQLSVRQIGDAVRAKYGTVDQMALAKMEEALTSPLGHVADLDKHLASFKRHMLMQTVAGYSIEEYRKVRMFRQSVSAHHQIAQCLTHHQIAQCLRDYDKDFPDPLTVTYQSITEYVVRHLPNIRAASSLSVSTPTGRVLMATASGDPDTQTRPAHAMSLVELQCAYSVLEHKHRNLQKRQKRGKRTAQDTKRHKDGKTTQSDQPITAASCKFYCHAHGYQNSHTSAQCKVVLSQKANFTTEMRQATSPTNPPGGSTSIRGQDN
jgi:hypothetical protein